MPEAYPVGVPFITHLSAISAAGPQGAVIRTAMDAGPVKRRRRFTAAPELLSGQTEAMDLATLQMFETWFTDTIKNGALSFDATHPISGVVRTFGVVGSYEIVTLRTVTHEYRVSMQLEVLP